jgi:hypothetical protein
MNVLRRYKVKSKKIKDTQVNQVSFLPRKEGGGRSKHVISPDQEPQNTRSIIS